MRLTKTNRTFHIIFLLTFGWIVLNVFLKIGNNNISSVLCSVALAGAAVLAYKLIDSRVLKANKENYDKTFWIMFCIMLLLQLVIGYLLMYQPGSDLWRVHEFAKSAGSTGSFDHIYDSIPSSKGYLARYPNNNALFLLLSGYYRILYFIFGNIPLYASVVLNVAALSISVLFTYKTAKKIFPPAGAFLVFLLCFLFLPYYTYTPYFYTDSLSMPFMIVPLYLYVSALKTEQLRRKYINLALFAVFVFIGFSLKGSIVILLVGAVAFLFLSIPIKKALLCSGTVISVFLVFMLAFNSFSASLNFTTPEELNEQEYPLTHWIMMGLKGNGGFDQADSSFTRSCGDYDAKKAANIEEIKNRIQQYGFVGMFDHLTQKGTWAWSDGTYFIGQHISNKPLNPNVLHQFVLPKGAYYENFVFASNTYLLMLLLLICISAVSSIIKPKMNFSVLLKGIIFGVFLFFLVWETRSRYLLNFTPVYILTAVDGIIFLSKIRRNRSKTLNAEQNNLRQRLTEE